MSMLAERKRKRKWGLNPQGNLWSKDTSSFGQKMLARMGWKEGQGLGRNEDGQTSVIRVSYKSDMNGMGYKESDESSVQQDDFNTLLKQLSNTTDVDVKQPHQLKSLEQKSQNSRARVHYKKFTRGKDLSQYSERDLANIFGKKKLTAGGVVEEEKPVSMENGDSAYSNLIGRGSMADYFKNKMPNFQTFGLGFNGATNNDNGDISDSSSSKAGEAVGDMKSKKKKKSKEAKMSFVSYVSDEVVNTTPKKKKRKCSEEQSEEVFLKKHKTELKCQVSVNDVPAKNGEIIGKPLENLGVINPAFEPLHSTVVVRKHVLDKITENDELQSSSNEDTPKKKKKKSKRKNSFDSISNGMRDNSKENLGQENKGLREKHKKHKQKTAEVGLANPAFEELNHCAENDTTESNKSKKSKNKIVNVTNSTFESSSCSRNVSEIEDTEHSNIENSISKKKKKKKLKNEHDGIENPSFVINDKINDSEITIEDNPYEEKSKKKKRKDLGSLAIDNPTFDLNNDVSCDTSLPKYEVKRKGKKKSKGLDNPALDLNDSNTAADPSNTVQEAQSANVTFLNSSIDISECDIMLNVVDEPVKATNTNTPKSKGVRFSKFNKRHIYSEYTSPDDITKRNELFDINTKVIQQGLRDSKKGKHQLGQDNHCFDANAQRVEESVNQLSNDIDRYQAEVENSINESKDKVLIREEQMIGEVSSTDGANEAHEEGVTLRYKFAQFESRVPYWLKNKDSSASLPKRSYKHLIRGDIVVGFKNSNLHEIDGYGKRKKL